MGLLDKIQRKTVEVIYPTAEMEKKSDF